MSDRSYRSVRLAAAILSCALLLAQPAGLAHAAETLYATSLRSEVQGATVVAGNLYVVNPLDGAASLVGAIRVGDVPVGIAALATHPRSGVVYGITAGLSPGIPRSLVEIDLHEARAKIVAGLNTRGTDIAFADDGTLFMWAPDLHQVVRVDLETGLASPVGMDPVAGSATGSIVIDSRSQQALLAVTGAQGTLDTVDLGTGAVTKGPALTGAVYDASIDNMTLSPAGILFAVNSNGGAPSKAALVTLDPSNGRIQPVGKLPDDVRGLIFAPARPTFSFSRDTLRKWALVALALVAAGLLVAAARRR